MKLEATPTVAGGRYSLSGSGLDRPVQVVSDWAAPYWIEVDADGNLDFNESPAPEKPGSYTLELRHVSADDHATHGYPYPQEIAAVAEVPAREPDPDHPDFSNPDNDIDGSHPGTPAYPGQEGVKTVKAGTVDLTVTKA